MLCSNAFINLCSLFFFFASSVFALARRLVGIAVVVIVIVVVALVDVVAWVWC
jgi:hypothetical protein